MDEPGETPLAMAERHVAEFERSVNMQERILAGLRLKPADKSIIHMAERLLVNLQTSLDVARDHLRIEQERHGGEVQCLPGGSVSACAVVRRPLAAAH